MGAVKFCCLDKPGDRCLVSGFQGSIQLLTFHTANSDKQLTLNL